MDDLDHRLIAELRVNARATVPTLAKLLGVARGTVRFNLLNGYLAQRLLFAKGLERKPVSIHWFRVLWPLLWQRRLRVFLLGMVLHVCSWFSSSGWNWGCGDPLS